MSDILTKILRSKQVEVNRRKEEKKISDFEASSFFNRRGKSLKKAITEANRPAIITEFKREQVSEGVIHENANVQTIVRGFVSAGATGVCVVTEKDHFGGKLADLKMARQVTESPLIRKDYIIDEFQLFEARANGADVVILVAEILETEELFSIAKQAKELMLEVIMEVESVTQLEKVNEFVDFVCVNINNTNAQTAIEISKELKSGVTKLVAGNINSVDTVKELHRVGYKGFIIGRHFMEQENPAIAAEDFIQSV